MSFNILIWMELNLQNSNHHQTKFHSHECGAQVFLQSSKYLIETNKVHLKFNPWGWSKPKLLMHEIQVCSLGFRVIGFSVLIIVCQSNQTEHDGWGSREVVSSRYEGSSSSSRYPILEITTKNHNIFNGKIWESIKSSPSQSLLHTFKRLFCRESVGCQVWREDTKIYNNNNILETYMGVSDWKGTTS
jgi:hypothetical protein